MSTSRSARHTEEVKHGNMTSSATDTVRIHLDDFAVSCRVLETSAVQMSAFSLI